MIYFKTLSYLKENKDRYISANAIDFFKETITEYSVKQVSEAVDEIINEHCECLTNTTISDPRYKIKPSGIFLLDTLISKLEDKSESENLDVKLKKLQIKDLQTKRKWAFFGAIGGFGLSQIGEHWKDILRFVTALFHR
jgi:hypothetical protein